jgi:hypothetical protein
MWEPRPLATLGASMACNREVFYLLLNFKIINPELSKILTEQVKPWEHYSERGEAFTLLAHRPELDLGLL